VKYKLAKITIINMNTYGVVSKILSDNNTGWLVLPAAVQPQWSRLRPGVPVSVAAGRPKRKSTWPDGRRSCEQFAHLSQQVGPNDASAARSDLRADQEKRRRTHMPPM